MSRLNKFLLGVAATLVLAAIAAHAAQAAATAPGDGGEPGARARVSTH
ncbi:MAG TPA: hypothetical protein VM146_19910 [Steroidobacteraceae bacterium]|nr:hypothetical protein [Steroidobacteraceae bacterium]